jgi:adenylosuccinate lyase
MKANLELDEEQMAIAAEEEKKRRRESSMLTFGKRHEADRVGTIDDVMAHVHTFGIVAPEAAPIIQ